LVVKLLIHHSFKTLALKAAPYPPLFCFLRLNFMLARVLRRWPLLLFLLGLAAGPARATHLLGGEMTYRYLDANGPAAAPVRYELTVTIYNNSNPGAAAPNTAAVVGIYNPTTGAKIQLVQGTNVLVGSGRR